MIRNTSCIHIVVAAPESSRTSLLAALHSEPSFHVIGEASDEAELLALLHELQPRILLLDSALAGLVNRTERSWPAVRTILLAAAIDEEHVVQALRLRARAIVQTAAPPEEVLKTIHAVLESEYCMGGDSIAILIQLLYGLLLEHKTEFSEEPNALTAQEHNIVAMIAAGNSNKEIGHALSISERTVKHHLTSIFGKLGLSSRLQLAAFAARHRLATHPGRGGAGITVRASSAAREPRRPSPGISLDGS